MTNSVTTRPMLTAWLDITVPASATTLTVTGGVQMLLDGRDRKNPLMRVFQLQPRLFRLDGPRLDEKDAGDDLQAVGDTVLQFFQQHVLFLHQFLYLLLYGAAVGNILEGQQHGAVGVLLVEYLSDVEQHDAPADRGKLAVDFVALDGRAIFCDRIEQLPQLGNIPLAAVDIEKNLAAKIVTGELKGLIKGAAGGDDALILVEHQERIAHGVDDRV